MREKVYWLEASDNDSDTLLCERLKNLIETENLLDCIAYNDITAVKTHFGESLQVGYPPPPLPEDAR